MNALKNLKFSFFTMLILSMVMVGQVNAQDGEITNDELRKYALLNEVVDLMKKDISVMVNGLIKSQEGMTGKRFKELMSAKGDKAKYEAMGAKEFEVKFMELIAEKQSKRIDAIKTVNQELATKMVGDSGKTYKKIKSALAADEALKARYDQIVASLKGTEG